MKPEVFLFFSNLISKEAGIHLTSEKAYLLDGRLSPVARKHNLKDLSELAQKLALPTSSALKAEVIDALTTNESFFFRDVKPFDQFRDVTLPLILKNNAATKKFRIWSAACSSGQEAYSLAMLLKEQGQRLAGWQFEIVGTDLSTEMVVRAKSGIYSQFEVQRGLPVQLLVKYFKRSGANWVIDESIRKSVNFRHHNLLSDCRAFGKFDVVFCRNVLIYFEPPTKRLALSHIAKVMAPEGVLVLGGAETILGVSEDFSAMIGARGLYKFTNKPIDKSPANSAPRILNSSVKPPMVKSGERGTN